MLHLIYTSYFSRNDAFILSTQIMPYAYVNKRDLESPQLESDADLCEKDTKKRKRDEFENMKLVNPHAVYNNLRDYESRVEREILKFKKYEVLMHIF